MICHQGSACASQRLRRGSLQQPKVSPPPAKHTHFIHPSTPKSHAGPQHIPHRGVRASLQPRGRFPREGTAAHSPSPPPAGSIAQAWDSRKTPSVPPPPSRQLRLPLGASRGARGVARSEGARTSQGCPESPGTRSTRLLPRLQSGFGAERPRCVEMPLGLSAAATKPIRAGIFRRVFQTSA